MDIHYWSGITEDCGLPLVSCGRISTRITPLFANTTCENCRNE